MNPNLRARLFCHNVVAVATDKGRFVFVQPPSDAKKNDGEELEHVLTYTRIAARH